jgi:hypothetical protein
MVEAVSKTYAIADLHGCFGSLPDVFAANAHAPLYPQKPTFARAIGMSALCQSASRQLSRSTLITIYAASVARGTNCDSQPS